jgi:hypothetical protein
LHNGSRARVLEGANTGQTMSCKTIPRGQDIVAVMECEHPSRFGRIIAYTFNDPAVIGLDPTMTEPKTVLAGLELKDAGSFRLGKGLSPRIAVAIFEDVSSARAARNNLSIGRSHFPCLRREAETNS